MQSILFRTSEFFAPFNVEVSRLSGKSNFDAGNGSTTIFIGADTNNVQNGVKIAYAHSGLYGSDFPGQFHDGLDGQPHAPNSNPFDLAWVDPVGQDNDGNWVQVWDTAQISRDVAHEAGHTFGLAHVLSSPSEEMMSYNAPNTRFANLTFTITTLDNFGDGKPARPNPNIQPSWDGTDVVTQNSFTYLQTILGSRPDDGNAHVAHTGSVDPTAYVAATDLSGAGEAQGTIARLGDYQVYSFTGSEGRLLLQVQATASDDGGPTLVPQVFVYDANGNSLGLDAELAPGKVYTVVVGAHDGASLGGYHLSWLVLPPEPQLPAHVGPLDPVANPGDGVTGPWSDPWAGGAQFINPGDLVIAPWELAAIDSLSVAQDLQLWQAVEQSPRTYLAPVQEAAPLAGSLALSPVANVLSVSTVSLSKPSSPAFQDAGLVSVFATPSIQSFSGVSFRQW